jgi:hypothetical protein
MKGIDNMKNYKVIATRFFRDSNEIDKNTGLKKERNVNDEFYCTKERYEYLKANNAVKLVEIQETIDEVIEEEKVEEPKIEVEENEIKINASEIRLIAENDKEITINREEVKPKPKKKKSKKK